MGRRRAGLFSIIFRSGNEFSLAAIQDSPDRLHSKTCCRIIYRAVGAQYFFPVFRGEQVKSAIRTFQEEVINFSFAVDHDGVGAIVLDIGRLVGLAEQLELPVFGEYLKEGEIAADVASVPDPCFKDIGSLEALLLPICYQCYFPFFADMIADIPGEYLLVGQGDPVCLRNRAAGGFGLCGDKGGCEKQAGCRHKKLHDHKFL